MIYCYGMRLRGFSPGCQPMKGLLCCLDDGQKKRMGLDRDTRYKDVLAYKTLVPLEQCDEYDLDYLGIPGRELANWEGDIG